MAEQENEVNIEELVEELIDRFDTEINVQVISANSAIREETDRYQEKIEQCIEKNLPNFESLTLGFSRKVELELVNFKEIARGLQKFLREKLIEKLPNYDHEAVSDFTERSATIIDEEGENLRERLRSTFVEYSEERGSQITKLVKEFNELKHGNDNKRRLRATAMLSPYTPESTGEVKSLSLEFDRKMVDFSKLFETISESFTDTLATNTKLSRALIDHCIEEEMSLFMAILSNFNDELYRVVKNQKQFVNNCLEQAIEQLNKVNDSFDDFSIAAHSLEQKAKIFFEGIERQLEAAVAELDKYRDEERRKIICISASTRRPLEEGVIYAVPVDEEILYDGRMSRRPNAATEIDLDACELHIDENYRESCELRKAVLLKRIVDFEAVDVETFAVQNYQHTNLLRCLGTGRKDRVRYLVFEKFPETLLSLMSDRSMGRDEYIQYTSGLQQALQYLHENNNYHGDLRPENVFFEESDEYNKVKLAHFSTLGARGTVEMESAEQTPFSAPEAGPIVSLLLLQKSDIWSFGTLIWYALTGVTPAEEKIVELPSSIPETSAIRALGDLLKKCWSLKVEDRPSIADIRVQLINIVTDIALAFEEEEQWTEEIAEWKKAAVPVAAPEAVEESD